MSFLFRALKVASTAVTALAVVLAVGLVGVRFVGIDVYSVLSGSMEPTYHTGSVIWVKTCEPQDVEVGDPITFVMNEDLLVATHRVVDIDEENGEFTTKGDANDHVDANPVLFENLIGKPVFSVPGMGYFVNWIQNPPGTYIAISVGAVLLILVFLPDLFAKEEEGEENSKTKKAKGTKHKKRGMKDVGRFELEPQQPASACSAQRPTGYARSVVPERSARPAAQARPAVQRPVRSVPTVPEVGQVASSASEERVGAHGRHARHEAPQGAAKPTRPATLEVQARPRGRHAR